MIKSLLDDEEEDLEPKSSGRKGLFRGGDREPEILGIGLGDPGKDEESDESVEAIKAAIEGREPDLSPVREEPLKDISGSAPEDHGRDLFRAGDLPKSKRTEELEAKLREIEDELRREKELEESAVSEIPARTEIESETAGLSTDLGGSADASAGTPGLAAMAGSEPLESPVETFRKSGLAWSAAIALFGSVVFMLILGWFADLLLGTSPWGKVAGIVVGAIVGFTQFFRITSQILRPQASDFEKVSLRSASGEYTAEEGLKEEASPGPELENGERSGDPDGPADGDAVNADQG